MSKRGPKLLIEDMLNAIEKIERYPQNIKSVEQFMENDIISDGVIRNLEIIGEAARSLPIEIYQKYSDISWKVIKDQISPLKEKLKIIWEEIK